MNFVKNCALSVGLFALTISLSASQANAEGLRGTFNLPFQAHWGTAVLDPGEYALRLSTGASSLPVMYVSGQGKTIMVVLAVTTPTPQSEDSYLRVEDIGQAHVIREFRAGFAGKVFTFSVPKSVKDQATVVRVAQNTMIPVAPSGGN
jgi:hypothetical protein